MAEDKKVIAETKPDTKGKIKKKSFDIRSLQKYTSTKSMNDFNHFLEKLPQNSNTALLYIAGIVWVAAAFAGLFATIHAKQLTEIRLEKQEVDALEPLVPEIKNVAVSGDEVKAFVDEMVKIYPGLNIKASGASVVISSQSTQDFGRFREAVGHVLNGGSGWQVTMEQMCVGRECQQKTKAGLNARLKINKVSVEKPS